MVKVSVIVPVYNVENYLRDCLNSLAVQTLNDIEFICIDDGSTDNSLKILREYEALDKRFKVVSKPNSGYGASMNIGLRTACGQYIGILESDDFAEPEMFEILYNTARDNNLDLVRCQYYHYNTSKNEDTLFDNSWVGQNQVYTPLENQTPFYQAPAIWTNLFKSSMIKDNDISFLETPGASFQDTSFAFKLYASSKRFMMIPDVLLHYRIDNSFSSVKSLGKVFYVNKEYSEIKRFAMVHNIYDNVKKLIPVIKTACYKWNYNRLASGLKRLFLFRWSLECAEDFLKGNIDWKMFDKRDYKRLVIIAFFPLIYFFRRSF